MAVPVFLINLDRSTDRLAATGAMLERLNLGFSRIPAVDGRAVPERDLALWRCEASHAHIGRALLPGEIGCYLSHVEAAKQIVAQQLSAALVLEDDAEAHRATAADLAAICEAIDTGGLVGWDLINLARPARRLFRKVLTLPSGATLGRAYYFPVTTTAILWSAAGAERFVNEHRALSAPIDVVLQEWLCQSGRGMASVPPLFSDRGAESVIAVAGPDRARRVKTVKRLTRQLSNNLAALRRYVLGNWGAV